ncbi:patatin-like phospholipase [Chloropicon primus]|nr:hypothetical protein A3770_03p19810 [Chloropicon primus]UPQ98673.1 patatin-like phospholipase [Chloropicon primus]|eukprot:QDZ19463.1 hypothetical protein A3770_03p19810 [Chloropicon primus]
MRIKGIMGTSAGAITGSLFSAGYSAEDILRETTRDPPWKLLRPNLFFWEGLFCLDAVVERMRELLPATFEELTEVDFACAVLSSEGAYTVVDSGALPEAVVASAAIPFLFKKVEIPGREDEGPFADGGARERVGLAPWRERVRASRSGDPPLALVHLIQRSFGPFSGNDDMSSVQETHYSQVTSPKSGVTLLSLGDYEKQYEEARARTKARIADLGQQAPRRVKSKKKV